MKRSTIIAPSLLSADFANLAAEIRDVEEAGADWIHLDVMDGHFVPNLTFGPPVIARLRPLTRLPFDVHLMIAEPDRYIDDFVEAGADILTVHAETCPHLHRTVQRIKGRGIKVGVAVNPATPPEAVKWVIGEVDLVLVMTVNPGFAAQRFIPEAVGKIPLIRKWAQSNPGVLVEVDGGIGPETAAVATAAGADVLVAGSAVFGRPDRRQALSDIRKAAAHISSV
ncbi:MAG: ribulose-phosphate 3-epimerase [Alicyclobacillaceae bacterium]|nr:ribulose-phosphate 3-epimerase [Alicyclobacillaceae bacterium]